MRSAAKPIRALSARRGAFTVVELLVVVAIIGILVAILFTVLGSAFIGAKRSATEQRLGQIAQAVEQFNADFGYYPPLIDFAMHAPESSGSANVADELRDSRYMSALSLAIYLVGVGDINQDGDQVYDEVATEQVEHNRDDGADGPGIRNPGPDKSWGGAVDRRNASPPVSGRVYGPYVDASSGNLVRRLTIEDMNALKPVIEPHGVTIPTDQEELDMMFNFSVLQDAWGNPIRYYKGWLTRDADDPRLRSLDRVPVELLSEDALRGDPANADRDPQLLSAPFALLSAGPDGAFYTVDPADDARNADFDITTGAFSNKSVFDSLSGTEQQTLINSVADNVRNSQ